MVKMSLLDNLCISVIWEIPWPPKWRVIGSLVGASKHVLQGCCKDEIISYFLLYFITRIFEELFFCLPVFWNNGADKTS